MNGRGDPRQLLLAEQNDHDGEIGGAPNAVQTAEQRHQQRHHGVGLRQTQEHRHDAEEHHGNEEELGFAMFHLRNGEDHAGANATKQDRRRVYGNLGERNALLLMWLLF